MYSAKYDKLCNISIRYHNRQKCIHISSKLPSSWWETWVISLTFLYKFPTWHLWLSFCYFSLSLSVKLFRPLSLCQLLLLSTYFNRYLSTAWNQQLIHSCWIWYIDISNIHQPYISVSVSCDTKEHQYTFRTASYSRWYSHNSNKLTVPIEQL